MDSALGTFQAFSLSLVNILPVKRLFPPFEIFFTFSVHRLSFDEGRSWNKYSFTSIPLFVDGVLGEPGEETLIMT